jgi:hypothetical protein
MTAAMQVDANTQIQTTTQPLRTGAPAPFRTVHRLAKTHRTAESRRRQPFHTSKLHPSHLLGLLHAMPSISRSSAAAHSMQEQQTRAASATLQLGVTQVLTLVSSVKNCSGIPSTQPYTCSSNISITGSQASTTRRARSHVTSLRNAQRQPLASLLHMKAPAQPQFHLHQCNVDTALRTTALPRQVTHLRTSSHDNCHN